LQQFITPIVKVSKGKNYSRTYFTVPEYEQWLESTGNSGRGYTIKYYKGLGTSTSAEAKEYFSNLDTHQITFSKLSKDIVEQPDEDAMEFAPDVAESGSDLIDMVFRKDRVEDRKQWLLNCPKDIYLDYTEVTEDGLKYSEFINREYILFSKYDNDRSIPNLLDGFKTSQRKVLFGCLKRKLSKNEIKVAQLTGYIAEHSAYHHGEQSLQGTIVNMAQNYVVRCLVVAVLRQPKWFVHELTPFSAFRAFSRVPTTSICSRRRGNSVRVAVEARTRRRLVTSLPNWNPSRGRFSTRTTTIC